jgi:hypothetical protein
MSSQVVFGPGGPANNTVTVSASTTAPSKAAKMAADSAQSSGFYYLLMTVTQPTPVSLLQKILVTGAIPINMANFVSEVDDLTTGEVVDTLPGSADNSTATYSQDGASTILEPGHRYAIACKGALQVITNFSFQNKTGVTGDMYAVVTCFGPDFPKDQKFYHLNARFQLVANAMSDGTPDPLNPNRALTDYSIKVAEGGSIPLPYMNGPRLYVSLGGSMKTYVNKTTNDAQPVTFVQPNLTADPSDPCYKLLIDFLELTVTPSTVGINMTEVNSIGLPMQVNVDGKKNGVAHEWQVGFKAGARHAIFAGLTADASYKTLAVPPQSTPDPGPSTYRFLNPSYGVYNVIAKIPNVATFDPNYYKDYIDQVWAHYKNQTLTMHTDVYGTFVGQVDNNDVFVFTQTAVGSNTPPSTTYKYPKPQAYDTSMPPSTNPDTIGTYAALVNNHGVFGGSPEDVVGGEIGGAMGIAICRSTLLTYPVMTRNYPPYTDCPVAQYYTEAPVNLYGKLIHDWSLPSADQPDGENNWGGAYAWGLDDNCNQSSVLNVPAGNVSGVTVILQPFNP